MWNRAKLMLARLLVRWSRWLRYKTPGGVCWICGAAFGAGPYWAGAMTCNECFERWRWAHKPNDGIVVDPKGIGRLMTKRERRLWESKVKASER